MRKIFAKVTVNVTVTLEDGADIYDVIRQNIDIDDGDNHTIMDVDVDSIEVLDSE